ncbi:hypothetical protein MRS44_014124 [Fusarium solani]|uniref:uncharacterized protein n=1 Tax=Fusarium solani TaxID=169388 RepID=UPI0032C43CCA|nr:hypothetical protein MRS44_014124 [Fusarium solani]
MAAISVEDARAQIERIRQEYSLDGHEKLANLIDSALEILCNELYDSSTHFIQELLQNADDNHYSSKTPTVMLTYRPGRLRVDCNERGFQPENVEAICAIRHSTKLGQNQSYRYTGEKGIGFKSAFRVASRVWISSGPYSFRFDKSQRFGVVAPEWAEFPEPLKGYTSFLLELSPEYPEDELVDMLLHFDPAQLLFLRRLRHVHIRVVTDNGTKSNLKIRRVDKGMMTTLKVGDAETSFFVSKHRVGNMPLDPRRPNEPTSELLLVFPTPTAEDQPSQGKVYSGLPVGDVPGMKFLLNGSFILTASRLQVDTSSRWNQALRDSVADAFVAAIAQLRANGFRYLWPVFLPSTRESSGFFEPAFTKILETVKAHKMLESFSNDLARPSELVCVNRPEFIYQKDRTPFTLHSATEGRYLSDHYPLAATLRVIESLGLRPLSDREFLDDLRTMISRSPTWHHRPHGWHTDLAKALLRVSQTVSLRNELMHLPIIPLASGEWVSTCHDPKPVLMSGEIKPGELPAHEALPIVDALAAQDEDRRELCQRLGLRPIGTDQLCRYICEQHASPLFRPESWSTAHLVAHARLLAKVSWAIDVDLWFATSDKRRVKGSELYLMNQAGKDIGTTLGRLFEALQGSISIIHSDYLTVQDPAPQSSRQWEHFLTSKLKVSAIPRLVKIEARTSPCEIYREGFISSLCDEDFRNMLSFRLSEEFSCILHECKIEDVVEVLNDNWRDYAVWLECGTSASRAQKVMNNRLTQDIRNIPVNTSRGRVALKETFVPGLDVFLGDTLVPTLPLRNSGGKTLHHRLSLLGVRVEICVELYLTALRSLREQCCPGFEIVAHVYRRLQGLYDDNEQSIDEFFKAGEFIYVESPSSENDRPDWHWTNIDYCIERDIDLKSQYPGSQHFLQSLLATRKLTIYQLVQKAEKINISTTAQELADIIMAISEALPAMSGKAAIAIRSLKSRAIFPILTISDVEIPSPTVLRSANDEDWFIADQPHLRESFLCRVPLLTFKPMQAAKLDALFNALGLQARKLSKRVKIARVPKGPVRFSAPHTSYFRDRAAHITALIPSLRANRESLAKQMQGVRVCIVTDITQTYTLRAAHTTTSGLSRRALASCSFIDGRLYIFISAERQMLLRLSFIERPQIQAGQLPVRVTVLDYKELKDIDEEIVKDDEDMEYLGQVLVSQLLDTMFQRDYFVSQHWTSPLQPRNGRWCSRSSGDFGDSSPFTLAGVKLSAKMTDFLVANGIQEASRWRSSYPTYHIELAISAGDIDAPFSWKSAQVDRAEKYHIRDANKVKDVMVLVRISNIYSQPSYQLFADPWRLILSAQMGVQAGPVIKAVIKPQKETNSRPGSSLVLSSLNQSEPKILPFIANTAYEGSRTSFGAQSTHINDSHLPEKALFYYPPLRDGEIRLLRLSPGENHEGLRGIIYSLPFRAAQSFHAASYVWGDADVSKHKITTPEGFIPITASLYGVFKRLRNVQDPVLIWVDAICIDQSDAIEKATQIQLLPRIFQRASSTLAVLNQGPISEFALEMLMQVRAHTLCETESSEWPDDLPRPPRSWRERGMPPEDEHTSYLITKLFEDPWFTRVWIVQEAVASPVVKFICGKYIVDWDHLYDSVCHLKQNLQLPAAVHRAWRPFNTLSKLRVWEARQVRWSILLLLETFRNVRSTLTRDRFFALLGIACDGDLPGFRPDYQAPLQDVVCSFARSLVAEGMGMKLLYRAGLGSQPHRFPSWVPDWTVPKLPGLYDSRSCGVVFNACGTTEVDIAQVNRESLAVRGYHIDCVKETSKAENRPSCWAQYFDEIDRLVDSSGNSYSDADRKNLKWVVPIAESQHPAVVAVDALSVYESYKAFRILLEKDEKRSCAQLPKAQYESLVAKSSTYKSLLEGSQAGWKFAVTFDQRFGIVPPTSEAGDEILIFAGGVVPFVIRRSEERAGAYRLIGECYISGIMHGEIFDPISPMPSTVRLY